MIDLLFLDTYYVSSREDVFDIYAFIKDIIVPTSAIFVSIYAVYLGIKKQNKVQYQNKEKEQLAEREILTDIILENNPLLIEAIDNSKKNLNKTIESLDLSNFSNFTITTISNVHFKIINGFGYNRIFEIIDRENDEHRKLFSKYWVAVDTFENNYDKITLYLQMVYDKYNKQNDKLNDLTHLIAIETADNIHSKIPPFTTITVSNKDLEVDPHLKLAISSHQITDIFNSSKEAHLVKLKSFLTKLFELKNDSSISKILQSDYVQKLEQAISILNSMESLFDTAKASIGNYLSIFDKNRLAIEKFNNMLNQKLKTDVQIKLSPYQKFKNWFWWS